MATATTTAIHIPPLNTAEPGEAQLAQWEAQLWDKGYLVIPNALPPEAVEHFRERIAGMPDHPHYGTNSLVCLFEQGMDFVALLENQPIISLMRRILGTNLHIIALQGHRMFQGNEVLTWHSDELYVQRPPDVSDDVEFPPVINVINCHYYLVDVPEEIGPTQVVPGAHRACRRPRPEDGDPPKWRGQGPVTLACKAGDCIMYSNQMWHRGAPNQTDRTRLAVVPCYSRRFVAQRFWPFVNYQIPKEILDQCTEPQRDLLGMHRRGAYG
jgi:phytanoyl-CoA dioxygenase PhyH